ncbi:hypothetical protein QBC46DRAFT_297042 [Diplogelasinospora grovesii]|uniref:Heterokaryon incompatibility domain-containing protein n=1 Tax=Diplogelasinospora grovesii TaxID=303347 RepID=A0AAN6S0I4_9PEZI|nr:hypothetical protein QBC46DRAFT_297042 [Diplogelasinospora grovesii]
MDVVVDTSKSLAEIRAACKVPIASALLDIVKYKRPRPVELQLRSLECLSLAEEVGSGAPPPRRLRTEAGAIHRGNEPLLKRKVVDIPNGQVNYVAVSWTWTRPEDEDHSVGGYLVESRQGGSPVVSKVRDAVLRRVLAWSAHVKCPNIWIDQECIDQENSDAQEKAIQSMDLVYSRSKHPVALLSARLDTQERLTLLKALFQLQGDGLNADAILNLLSLITSDPWWNRAWTFQEDYKASIKMAILIHHNPSLEQHKLDLKLGSLPGELCLNSADFRHETTRFCLAYQNRFGENEVCKRIIKVSGKYKVLLAEPGPLGLGISRSMSPTIFDDIGSRGIAKESDRLAIAANCCGYQTRLDTESLRTTGRSLSLSMLALYLLNGEIIKNDNGGEQIHGALSDNVFKFLKKQSFDNFRPPDEQELTFIKSCRFPRVELTLQGMKATGHLWKPAPQPIYAESVSDDWPPSSRSGRTQAYRQTLENLAMDLQEGAYFEAAYHTLACRIQTYLDSWGSQNRRRFYQDLRAEELIEAIQWEEPLLLACPVDPQTGTNHSPYEAIFILSEDCPRDRSSMYFFTAEKEEDAVTGDLTRHVSLVVQCADITQRTPRLIIKGWASGLCFPEPRSEMEVLFPWPSFMTA